MSLASVAVYPRLPGAGGLTERQVRDITETDLITAVRDDQRSLDRTLQKEIGPSEVGSPCKRQVGYKLLGMPHVAEPEGWPSWVGTAAHEAMHHAVEKADAYRMGREGTDEPRWICEETVWITDKLYGHFDLYDRNTLAVVDHKFVGPSKYADVKKHGCSRQYRVQGQLYSLGMARTGNPVEWVVIVFWPRGGSRMQPILHVEPYDEAFAVAELAVLEGIEALCNSLGPVALEVLPATENYCAWCEYYRPGSTDAKIACPGVPGSSAARSLDRIRELVEG